MRVDEILHPALELRSHEVLYILFIELLAVVPILVGNLHLWIIKFNQISFIGQWLRVDAEILRLVEKWIDLDQL